MHYDQHHNNLIIQRLGVAARNSSVRSYCAAERGEWWLSGNARPWQSDAVNVLSDKLVFKPRSTPIAGRDLWHP